MPLWWSAPDPFSGRIRGRGERTANLGRRQKLGPREVTRFREARRRAQGPRRRQRSPDRPARPRPGVLLAAPEWVGETSVRRRGWDPGRAINTGSRLAAAAGRRCAPGLGVRSGTRGGRAQLLQLSGGGERPRRGEEERVGGGMEGTRGYPCSGCTNSRSCCFQLLPPSEAGSVSAGRSETRQRSRSE